MKGTRLNEILSSLSKEEFLRLNDFLHSPYLNKNKQIILFYYFLKTKDTHPDYSIIKRENVFAYIYNNQIFNIDKYLKVSSDFVKAVEEFLVYEFRDEKKLERSKILLEISGNRSLPKTFSKYSGEIQSKLDNEFNKDLEFYLTEYDFKIESILYSFNSKKFNLEKALFDLDGTVNNVIVHLKLELILKLFHLSDKNKNIRKNLWLENEVIEFIKKNEKDFVKNHPMIYLKSRMLKMFIDDDKSIFDQIKTYVEKNERNFSKENLIYFYDIMMTFCSVIDDDEFRKEEFLLIRSLEKNSLLNIKESDYIYFLKIIDSALIENDAYWAENFLIKHKENIDPEFRESTVNLAMASIYIYRQKYDKALEHVSQVSAHSDFFYLSSKTMSLIIFYNLNDLPSINYGIESFSTYLKRNSGKKESSLRSYKTFLDLYKELIKIKFRNTKNPGKKEFLKKIENLKTVLNKEWFIREVLNLNN